MNPAKRAEMKEIPLIILGILLSAVLLLSGCAGTFIVTVADATTVTTYTDKENNWEQVRQNSEGMIDIAGEGGFYYRLVEDYDKSIFFSRCDLYSLIMQDI
jgi:PBP1b-binding outer membrane lipoprotein LpoB